MSDNPFASYNIEVPKKYAEDIKKFCQTAGGKETYEFTPFNRQVDFWYFALIYAVKKELDPVIEKETSNITPATILSTNIYRISHIQLAFLGATGSIEELAHHRKVFDYALSMANAGFPRVLQILRDPDERPLWQILDEIEGAA
jgi:hypothetical protein